jgi:hypothetical protein
MSLGSTGGSSADVWASLEMSRLPNPQLTGFLPMALGWLNTPSQKASTDTPASRCSKRRRLYSTLALRFIIMLTPGEFPEVADCTVIVTVNGVPAVPVPFAAEYGVAVIV